MTTKGYDTDFFFFIKINKNYASIYFLNYLFVDDEL